MTDVARRRPIGRILVVLLFAVLSASAAKEAFWSDSPPVLRVWQVIVAIIAAVTVLGAWSGARWSVLAATLYGLVTGAMIAALGPLLDLPASERGGLWFGGAVVLMVSLLCAWYLRRATSAAAIEGESM